MEIGREIANALFLVPLTLQDARKMEVSGLACLVYAGLGIIRRMLCGESTRISSCVYLGAVLGMLFLPNPLSGAFGTGDVLVLLACAAIAGIWSALEMLFLALFPACVYAIYLVAAKKSGLKAAFPFVPFLLISQLVRLLLLLLPGGG